MTQKRRKQNRKWLGWMLFAVLLTVAGVVCYFVWDNYFNKRDDGKEPDTSVTESKPEEKKEEEKKEEKKEEPVIEKEKVILYDGDDPNEAEELTGAITFARVSGENIMIRLNIDQYLTGGSCKLSLTQNSNVVYSETAGIIDAAATSTCEGFNVPRGDLSGRYQITIKIESGDKTGTITGEVDV